MLRAGLPTIRLPGSKLLPSVTRALAPITHSSPITAWLSNVAPMPTSTRAPIVHPCRIAWCPIVHSAPIVSGTP